MIVAASFLATIIATILHSSNAVTYISDIRFLLGKHTRTPDGYTKLPQDLNSNAGGEYIYLIYKTSTDRTAAYDNLDIVAVSTASGIPIRPGFQLISQDLAQGAGGKYIFLMTTKNATSPQAITDLEITVGVTRDIYPSSGDFHRIQSDLNEGAGGDYVYLSYKVAPTEIVVNTVPATACPEIKPETMSSPVTTVSTFPTFILPTVGPPKLPKIPSIPIWGRKKRSSMQN